LEPFRDSYRNIFFNMFVPVLNFVSISRFNFFNFLTR
jgi:hypothetical protein